MKLGIVLITFVVFSFSAMAGISCKEKWNKMNYPKTWKVTKIYQTSSTCGYVIKKKNQTLEEIVSKKKGISVLEGEHDFLGLCKVSYPNSDQMNCPVGTMKKISKVTGKIFKKVNL